MKKIINIDRDDWQTRVYYDDNSKVEFTYDGGLLSKVSTFQDDVKRGPEITWHRGNLTLASCRKESYWYGNYVVISGGYMSTGYNAERMKTIGLHTEHSKNCGTLYDSDGLRIATNDGPYDDKEKVMLCLKHGLPPESLETYEWGTKAYELYNKPFPRTYDNQLEKEWLDLLQQTGLWCIT